LEGASDYFLAYKMEVNTKLENIGSVRIPKADAKPKDYLQNKTKPMNCILGKRFV
jgi:hypothetical protein